MDGFGDNFVSNNEVDPAAEFLAREQDQLAGIDDDDLAVQNSVLDHGTMNGDISNDVNGMPEIFGNIPRPQSVSPVPVKEVPEKIKIWREKQQQMLMEKDAAEEVEKEKLREKAKKELEEWYSQHQEQVVKTRKANRSAEKELVADTSRIEPGTEWERISKLCDFNPKTAKSSRDVSRMRSIILQLKQNPPVKA